MEKTQNNLNEKGSHLIQVGKKEKVSFIEKKLTFKDRENFTMLVENMIEGERKKSQNIIDDSVNILFITEKPSAATSISNAFNGLKKYYVFQDNSKIKAYEFVREFRGVNARVTVASVYGHIYNLDFQAIHNDWTSITPIELFGVETIITEANQSKNVEESLKILSKGKDILCLWLDCDLEGENICYEVIYNCYPEMNKKNYRQIYRSKFSSLNKDSIIKAYSNLSELPNEKKSLSVEARRLIDLKVGVSYTRYLTSVILNNTNGIFDNIISFGPCQTPTLGFIINRENEIKAFKSQTYFKINCQIKVQNKQIKLNFEDEFMTNAEEFQSLFNNLKKQKNLKLVDKKETFEEDKITSGLNTLELLMLSSRLLKISPHRAMAIAEKLYLKGFITYPRTETTKYDIEENYLEIVKNLSETQGIFDNKSIEYLKNNFYPKDDGVKNDDHPPITPCSSKNLISLNEIEWKMYEIICKYFFASFAEPAIYKNTTYTFEINDRKLMVKTCEVEREGLLRFVPWEKKEIKDIIPFVQINNSYQILSFDYETLQTQSKEFLTEHELLKLMQDNRIGTDASIPTHIKNIYNRKYARLNNNRRLVSTRLGRSLFNCLSIVDSKLVEPTIRQDIEKHCNEIIEEKKTYYEVVKAALQNYKDIYITHLRNNSMEIIQKFKVH